MTITPEQSAFVAFIIEGVVYGFYTLLALIAVLLLTAWRRQDIHSDRFMLFFTCLLWACCTAHFCLEADHMYKSVVLSPEDIAIETNELIGADTLFSVIDFFGQIVLLYRCWLVWGRNYLICVIPGLISLAGLTCAMTGIGILTHTDPSAPIAPPVLVPLGDAGFALPLCFNFIVTGLIVGRIWWQARCLTNVYKHMEFKVASPERTFVRSAIGLMVESGLLYLVVQLVFVVLFALNHPAQFILVLLAVQIYGIAPTLIVVRAGLGVGFASRKPTSNSSDLRDLSFRRGKHFSESSAFTTGHPFFNTRTSVSHGHINGAATPTGMTFAANRVSLAPQSHRLGNPKSTFESQDDTIVISKSAELDGEFGTGKLDFEGGFGFNEKDEKRMSRSEEYHGVAFAV